MLTRSDEMIYSFVFNRSGKTLSFSLRYDISCIFFVDVLHQVEEISLYSWFTKSFIINGCWILSNVFSPFMDMTSWFFSFSLLIWWVTLIDPWMSKQACILGINASWLWHMILFIFYLLFFWGRVLLCRSDSSAVGWSRLIVASTSHAQAILPPQPPE